MNNPACRRRRWLMLCSAWMVLACGEPRLIGRACSSGHCVPVQVASAPSWPNLLPPDGCGTQLSVALEPSGASREGCQLFTLSDFGLNDATVYLTRVQVVMTPVSHVDVRLARQIPALADGPVPCDTLPSKPIHWHPLLTAAGANADWRLPDAPLALQRGDRVLVDYRYIDLDQTPVSIAGAKLNLECTAVVPAVVSHEFAFELSNHEPRQIDRGESVVLSDACVFSKAVVVSGLYRPTRRIVRYRVGRTEGGPWLWETSEASQDWTLEFPSPMVFEAGRGLQWECEYENREQAAFFVGGGAEDTCALYGSYHLPAGGLDRSPEHCGFSP